MPFHVKKEVTSALRRLAPIGLSTDIIWTANARTLRHVIEMRTAEGAEEELRCVFDKVARMMQAEAPGLFQDFDPPGRRLLGARAPQGLSATGAGGATSLQTALGLARAGDCLRRPSCACARRRASSEQHDPRAEDDHGHARRHASGRSRGRRG